MTSELMHDRGRGPEIVGTRITVYNLLPHFLDPTATEAYIGRLYELTPEQVAAARAYVLNNPDTVLARHLEIEARIAAGNPREVIERAERTRTSFLEFRQWLTEQQRAGVDHRTAAPASGDTRTDSGPIPTFRQWLAERESDPGVRS